jgi:hypothetical protein
MIEEAASAPLCRPKPSTINVLSWAGSARRLGAFKIGLLRFEQIPLRQRLASMERKNSLKRCMKAFTLQKGGP